MEGLHSKSKIKDDPGYFLVQNKSNKVKVQSSRKELCLKVARLLPNWTSNAKWIWAEYDLENSKSVWRPTKTIPFIDEKTIVKMIWKSKLRIAIAGANEAKLRVRFWKIVACRSSCEWERNDVKINLSS